MNNEQMQNNFRKSVRIILKEIGITQKELSSRVGMTVGQLNNKMNAERDFNLYQAIMIADELGEYLEDMCKGKIKGELK